MGIFLPGQIEPDSKLLKDWLDKVYYRADSIDALSAKIGVDTQGLKDTVAKMNEYAKTGVDPEFHKGETAIDRYYSDPSVKPNTYLGPNITPPFYAVKLDAGEIGTQGGLPPDPQARVLHEERSAHAAPHATRHTTAQPIATTTRGPGYPPGTRRMFA